MSDFEDLLSHMSGIAERDLAFKNWQESLKQPDPNPDPDPDAPHEFDYKSAYHSTKVEVELLKTYQALDGDPLKFPYIRDQLTRNSYLGDKGELVIVEGGNVFSKAGRPATVEDWVREKNETDIAFRSVFTRTDRTETPQKEVIAMAEFQERLAGGDTQLALDVKAGRVRVQ